MANWAIGDVHGCARTLAALVDRIDFDARRDRLWFTGDLVNRGPRSLEALRLVRGLGGGAESVLGNHDLHLLARARGVAAAKSRDTLDEVLAAPDREELLAWLARRPLALRVRGLLLVHAALAPEWSVAEALRVAGQLAEALAGPRSVSYLRAFPPKQGWPPAESEVEPSLVRALRFLTTVRFVDSDGEPRYGFTGPPEAAPAYFVPWFDFAPRAARDAAVLCGHWGALGLRQRDDLAAIDTGCVYGGRLTALRLEDRRVVEQPLLD